MTPLHGTTGGNKARRGVADIKPAITLPSKNSVGWTRMAMNISVFAKPHIASSVFRKAFALANDDQQDRMAQFRTDVQSAYENISAIDRTALSADFTNTPESFNKVMGFCFVTLGEIFQEEFNADMTRGAMPQFAAITLVAVALFPYSHKSVPKINNNRTGKLVDQKLLAVPDLQSTIDCSTQQRKISCQSWFQQSCRIVILQVNCLLAVCQIQINYTSVWRKQGKH